MQTVYRIGKRFSRVEKLIFILLLVLFSFPMKISGQETAEDIPQPKEEELIPSPDKKRALAIICRAGRPELWIMEMDKTQKRQLSKLGKDEGVKSAVWSPDGELIAFVSYNLGGHSPMTTTHVWVVRYDGSGLKKVTLPKPNERFSTYDPQWKDNETLIVKAITLPDLSESKYLYSYRTEKIKKITSEKEKDK